MTQTVLYVHGLEAGPRGRKARHLAAAGFTVVSEQMPCGRAQLARDPLVLAAGASAVAALVASGAAAGLRGLAVGALALGAAAPFASAGLMRRVFRLSVEVQKRSLAERSIDAVVASSFGGAVALELLRVGAWAGPTVLLCPAHELVAQRSRRPSPPPLAALPESVASRVVLVHGRADEVVPLAHSQSLAAGSRARLVLVDDDHRLGATADPERLAAWIALACGGST